MTDERLAALERKVADLTDRQEIYDTIVRVARANDRFDGELQVSQYHPEGHHEIASTPIPAAELGEHGNASHARICETCLHHVTMHSCDIDGDTAHTESYVIGLFLDKSEKTSRILSGRYIDRLERRDGQWKIVIRRATVEVILEGKAGMMTHPLFRDRGYLKGSRDKSDLSYTRPLTLDGGERWSKLPQEVEAET